MGTSSVLNLVNAACYEANIPVPDALYGETEVYTLQLLNLVYATCRELRSCRTWPQMKRTYFIPLEVGRQQYSLPWDFYAALPDTTWDQQNRWQMRGPLNDDMFNYRTYGYVTIENRKAYRVFGPDENVSDQRGQFWVNPVPNTTTVGQFITFEYMTRNYFRPKDWTPTTSYVAAAYVNASGNIYSRSGGGTSSTTAPTMANGVGQDGGVYWQYIATTAWAQSTLYGIGQYVTNSGNTYICTQQGTSSSSPGGPTSTSDSITDGTVIWMYISAPAWVGETEYGNGDYVTKTNLYLCVTPPNFMAGTSISGKVGPRWTATSETDGTVVWDYYKGEYTEILSDLDQCLFDDDLMILGLKWRFMQARGLEWEDAARQYQSMKARAVSRWNVGSKLSLAGGILTRNINIPEGGYGDI